MMRDWRAEVTAATGDLTTDQQEALTEALPGFAVVRHHADTGHALITITAPAAEVWEVLRTAQDVITHLAANWDRPVKVIGVRAYPDGNDPLHLDLVGFAEIAEMAGVSRQGARHIALNTPGFPREVGRTTNGPVYQREHVARFLEERKAARAAGQP